MAVAVVYVTSHMNAWRLAAVSDELVANPTVNPRKVNILPTLHQMKKGSEQTSNQTILFTEVFSGLQLSSPRHGRDKAVEISPAMFAQQGSPLSKDDLQMPVGRLLTACQSVQNLTSCVVCMCAQTLSSRSIAMAYQLASRLARYSLTVTICTPRPSSAWR